ncbi:acyl carrier protein [Kitasatospora cineracea]|uniref:acyl carrier protein n=1 Tax=Kitasatospora cineracea TaxID=88074 RepID=UPI00343ECCC8
MSTDARTRFGRAEALAMLARYGGRAPEQVDEHLGSLELTWLIAEAEQTYGVQLDLEDEHLDAIRTVDDAVAALGAQLDARLGARPGARIDAQLGARSAPAQGGAGVAAP